MDGRAEERANSVCDGRREAAEAHLAQPSPDRVPMGQSADAHPDRE